MTIVNTIYMVYDKSDGEGTFCPILFDHPARSIPR